MRNYEKNLNGILRNSLTVMENNGILGPIACGVGNLIYAINNYLFYDLFFTKYNFVFNPSLIFGS